ncbi:16577_t:CDS:2 [Funneliformis geosporum]|uniref:NADH dehydrogenase [ubiquinone] 1 alpha subcomplex subunit n=1 Tax=Funneliformis geosporum TaxID=1117311 RepID=A0A9W4SMX4_9GLOM|nr:16577_t:CDS:2 [Funneliformis geosporum]CAI2174444.1 15149_t:CDS:2 [Funneliformis geosporum]
MSSLTRTFKNFLKIGPKEYLRQMMYIGDTKAGTLVGIDQFGNKYYENIEEFFELLSEGRDRWVDYAKHYGDASQIPPEWHSWMHKITELPPTMDPPPRPKYISPFTENFTGTRKAFKTYNTTAPKILSWEPKVNQRIN